MLGSGMGEYVLLLEAFLIDVNFHKIADRTMTILTCSPFTAIWFM